MQVGFAMHTAFMNYTSGGTQVSPHLKDLGAAPMVGTMQHAAEEILTLRGQADLKLHINTCVTMAAGAELVDAALVRLPPAVPQRRLCQRL